MMTTRILLVEDEPVMARQLQVTLASCGYGSVLHASAPQEAIQMAERERPDIILMDIVLDDPLDGVDVARRIRERHNVPVIYLSARADDDTWERAQATEPYGYLTKPCDRRELRMAIEIALNRHLLQQQLQESEARFRRLAENAHDVIYRFRLSPTFACEYVNPAVTAIAGYTPDEYYADPQLPFKVVHPGDRATVEAAMRSDAPAGTFIARWIHRDGHTVWTEQSHALVLGPQGEPLAVEGIARDVTEQMWATTALQESEHKFRALFDQSHDGIVAVDQDGLVVEWNEAQERITGRPRREVFGRPLWDVQYEIGPEELRNAEFYARLQDGVQRMLRTAPGDWTSRAVDAVAQVPGGPRHAIQHTTFPIATSSGTLWCSIARDVTEQQLAEHNLRRRAAEFQALYDTALRLNAQLEHPALLRTILEQAIALLEAGGGALLVYDAERDLLCVSLATGGWETLAGGGVHSGEGIAGQAFLTRRTCYAADDSAWPACRPDGETSPRRGVLAVPLLGRAHDLGVLVIGTGERAVSEQQISLAELFAAQAAVAMQNAELHAELAQRARELAALNVAGQSLTSTLDLKAVLDLVIGESCALVGAEGASVLLHDARAGELVFAASAGSVVEPLIGTRLPDTAGFAGWVLREQRAVRVENATQDERFYALVDEITGVTTRSLISVPLMSKGVVLGVLEAINKAGSTFHEHDLAMLEAMADSAAIAIENARLYQAEREQFYRLQQSQAQMVQVEKMAAVGRLTASIAHEINNPLQAVQGWLSLVGEELHDRARRETMGRYLDIAQDEIERIADIVMRMRDFYRPAQEGRRPVDVHAILESVLALAGKQLQHSHVSVQREWSVPLAPVYANPDHLKQVFLNLLLNTLDAMPDEGGRLTIRTAQDTWADPGGVAARPVVRLEFCDTGVGIPAGVLPHIFEPFFTTKHGGSGLGLYISYGIIEAHGGQISVTSELGVGTTFTILLPSMAQEG